VEQNNVEIGNSFIIKTYENCCWVILITHKNLPENNHILVKYQSHAKLNIMCCVIELMSIYSYRSNWSTRKSRPVRECRSRSSRCYRTARSSRASWFCWYATLVV